MTFSPTPLDRSQAIVDSEGRPTFFLQRAWEDAQQATYEAILAIPGVAAAVVAAQAAADAAQVAADTANTAATNADAAAQQAAADSALATSGTSGLTITATDAGTDATIAISAHTRVYGDGTSVAVNAGNLTGRAYSTTYYIYYDDSSRAGGAVTYQTTTSQATAAQTGSRHSLGAVTTPAALGGPSTGAPNLPPGVVQP